MSESERERERERKREMVNASVHSKTESHNLISDCFMSSTEQKEREAESTSALNIKSQNTLSDVYNHDHSRAEERGREREKFTASPSKLTTPVME